VPNVVIGDSGRPLWAEGDKLIYRLVMRIAHKFNWHYAPPIHPEGDTQLWCKWCGFRQTIKWGQKEIRKDG
jgi:hypothetical protein